MRYAILGIVAAAVLVGGFYLYRNAGPDRAWTSLHEAARDGNMGQVETLLNDGADPNVQDPQGKTALHYAAANGHNGTVRVLLQHHADATLRDDAGRTAEDYAGSNGHTATASEFAKVTSAE